MPTIWDFKKDFSGSAFKSSSKPGQDGGSGPPKNDCEPQNIYGPYQQTLFLGCSVMSFSANVGWNEQSSEVNVQLVEDVCGAPSSRPKVYWSTGLTKTTTTKPDPGFMGESVNIIGMPVYFRVQEFEFAGIVQSWDKQNSSRGKVYTVKITDPREILRGTNIIIGDYSGPVWQSTGTGDSIYNVINAYGFAESFGVNCPPVAQNAARPGDYVFTNPIANPREPLPDGVVFGTSSKGFGGAKVNHNGMQWNRIKEALDNLINRVPSQQSQFSPFGRILFRGVTQATLNSTSFARGYGLMPTFATNDGVAVTEYFVDLSEVPTMPSTWRLDGTSMNLMEMISLVMEASGYDYYIEMIPIIGGLLDNSGIAKFIKIRAVNRHTQPTFGEITAFVAGSDGVIENSIGRELRNEPVSSLVIGGKKQFIYQANPVEEPRAQIKPFFGLDIHGDALRVDFIDKTTMTWPIDNEFTTTVFRFFPDVGFINDKLSVLEIDPIDPGFRLGKLPKEEPMWIDEQELLYALDGFDAWLTFVSLQETATYQALPEEFQGLWAVEKLVDIQQQIIAGNLAPRDLINLVAGANLLMPDLKGMLSDIDKIFEWVANFAEEYYGKQFTVELPFVCGYTDTESLQVLTDVQPAGDGWTDVLPVIGLEEPALSMYRTEDNKIKAFCKMSRVVAAGHGPLNSGLGDYREVTVSSQFVYEDKSTGFGPKAVFALDEAEHPISDDADSIAAANRANISIAEDFLRALELDMLLLRAGEPGNPGEDDRFDNLQLRRAFLLKRVGSNLSIIMQALLVECDIPNAVAIPLRSNVNSYGPWTNPGPPGKSVVDQQDGLVPWAYGSSADMSTAGQALADEHVSHMLVGELGSIQIAGYPHVPLGAEIGAMAAGYYSGGTNLVENRLYSLNQFSDTLSSGGAFSINYAGFSYDSIWNGNNGPNITSIQVDVGPNGATSTYRFRTFTPTFGKLAKLNADGIKALGPTRANLLRRIRQIGFNTSHGGWTYPFTSIPGWEWKSPKFWKEHRRRRANERGKKGLDPNSAHEVIVAEIMDWKEGISRTLVSDNPIIEVGIHTSQEQYKTKAMMSWDGFLRPVSMDGDGDLPRYIKPLLTNSVNLQSRGAQSPMTNGSTKLYEGTTDQERIVLNDLNPFTNPKTSPDHGAFQRNDLLVNKSDSDALTGHDIDILARRDKVDNIPGSQAHMVLPVAGAAAQTPGGDKLHADYTDDYRMLALKGPMLLQQWGYDTDGKPVPNSADTAAAASGGTFVQTNLKSTFLDGFLKKPHTWPVAPVDLRLDRSRGVWVAPPPYRTVVATLAGDLAKNGTASATVDTDVEPTVYDAAGTTVSTPTITIKERGVYANVVPGGKKVLAQYNPFKNEYNIVEIDLPSAGEGTTVANSGSGILLSFNDTCTSPLPNPDDEFIFRLNLGKGLYGQENVNNQIGNVQVGIDGSSADECILGSDIEDHPWSEVKWGKGIFARRDGHCKIKVGAGTKLVAAAQNLLPAITSNNGVAAGDGKVFNKITLGSGLYGKITEGAAHNCDITLGSAIHVKNPDSSVEASVTRIEFGDCLSLTLRGDESKAAAVDFKNTGMNGELSVVTGVFCSGSSIVVCNGILEFDCGQLVKINENSSFPLDN